jgi:type IV secretion system protein VirB9
MMSSTKVRKALVFAMLVPSSVSGRAKPLAHPLRDTVTQANHAATLGPRQGAFINATEVYPWTEGAIFRLFTCPGRVSDIALEPGETMTSVAAGDTVRWIVGNSTSGTADGRREHVLVKPTAAGLSTNLLILTDRRSYHLDLVSAPTNAMASVSWSYPKDSLISIKASAAPPLPGNTPSVEIQPDPTTLNFDYIISGEAPSWRPVLAFDDGRHVYIAFPASIGAGAAAPLFVTDGKTPELVNYRMRGRYYVVDRLFDHAELRLGDKPQHVVEISRGGQGRRP